MLVLVNVVLPTVTVAATDPAVRVRVALVSERLSPVRVPADRVTDPAAPPNSPQAPVFGPSIGSLKMLLGGVQNLSQIILAGVSRSRVQQSWLARVVSRIFRKLFWLASPVLGSSSHGLRGVMAVQVHGQVPFT